MGTLEEAGADLELFHRERENIVHGALNDPCTETNPKRVSAKRIGRMLDKIEK